MSTGRELAKLYPSIDQIPEAFRIQEPIHQRYYLVNNQLRPWEGEMQEIYSPLSVRTSEGPEKVLIGSHPSMDANSALEALDAAVKAYDNGRGVWATLAVDERIKYIEKFTERLLLQKEFIVKMLMWEIGKSLADSTKEFDRTIQYIYDTIDALKKIDRDQSRFVIAEGVIGQIRRAPVGVVLVMGPYNYPFNETFALLIPALIMGNTVLLKLPRLGVLHYMPLLEIFRDSFPKGVINTLYGKGRTVITPLMESGKIDVLALIGSSRTANELRKLHPKTNRLRAIFGLDAKNSAIVLDSANIDLAVKECILGSLSFNGQRCTAIKLIFVHRKIQDVFLSKLSEEIAKLKIGFPWEDKVFITPIAEPGKPEYLNEVIQDALSLGARIVNEGGGTADQNIMFPAVLFPVNEKMRLYREEQFGPVVPIVPFDHTDEPLEYLMQSEFGLQVSLFSQDSGEIARLIDLLVNQVCRVNINSQCQRGPDIFPFTGRRDSAERTLSVMDSLRSFSLPAMVATKDTKENKEIFNDIVREHESQFLSTRFIF